MRKTVNIVFLFLTFLLSTKMNAQFILVKDSIFAKAIAKTYPGLMSADSLSLDTIAAAAKTGNFILDKFGFKDVSELKYFKNITRIQFQNEPITTLPDLTGFTLLNRIDLRGSYWYDPAIFEPVKTQLKVLLLRRIKNGKEVKDFSFLNSYPNLTNIEFRNFNAEVLPDLSLFTGLAGLNITLNKFSFADLIPIANTYSSFGAGLSLMPQNNLTKDTTITVYCNQPYTISTTIDNSLTGITYVFMKDKNVIQSSASSNYTIESLSEVDNGNYQIAILSNHPYFSSDTLFTGNYTLQVLSTTNCMKVFSPNNDGIDDELYLSGKGEAIIRNKQGVVIKKIALPGSWDGNNQHGNPADIGVYSISDESKTTTITLLR